MAGVFSILLIAEAQLITHSRFSKKFVQEMSEISKYGTNYFIESLHFVSYLYDIFNMFKGSHHSSLIGT